MRKYIFMYALVIFLMNIVSVSAKTLMLEYDGIVHEYTGDIYSLIVNNKKISSPMEPIIFNDRALVPVREIFEEVGANVEYDSMERSVKISDEDTEVLLYINNNIAYVNGRKVVIPDNVVPKLIAKLGGETKTMVPVRFISESIGMDVEFDSARGAILIASDSYSFQEPSDNTDAVITYKETVDSVGYDISGNQLKVHIFTSARPNSVKHFIMTNPGRLVVDLYGMALSASRDHIDINEHNITSVRLGANDERVRVVIDSEAIGNYRVGNISDNEIEIVVDIKQLLTGSGENVPEQSAPVITPQQPTYELPVVDTVPVATPSPALIANKEAGRKIVMLDAGHGGTDSGAVGSLNGLQILEKDLTLSITYKVKEILEANGVNVSMTRTGDTLPSLVERPTQANNEGVVLFVSIHINSVDNVPTAKGIEVYYSLENNGNSYNVSSADLASSILKNLLSQTGAVNRGVKTANHAVTRRSNMPASLVECGFISNVEELSLMCSDDYQYRLAQGIADGIIQTLAYTEFPDL